MPLLSADVLRRIAGEIIESLGTPSDLAGIVGDSLVDANLAGHDSHGVLRLIGYARSVGVGDVVTDARPEVMSRRGATAVVDGAWAWGQVSMALATETVIDRARQFGVGAVVVRRCYHIGRAAPYVEAVARAGLVGIAMSNAGPAVAPYGGRRRVLGTNPVAWAVPRGQQGETLSFDIATAGIAEGKLLVARSKGDSVPTGLLVDEAGAPSQDPEDFYAGGALLPFGGHKGYGFSVLAQVLGRALAGMDTTGFDGPRGANGPLIIALDVEPFVPLAEFKAEVDAQCALIKASPPAEGFEEVLLPGEPEIVSRRRREREGVPVPDTVWHDLQSMAKELGVAVEV